MQATQAPHALLAVQATLAGMASLGRLGADGWVVRHGARSAGSPKDSGPAASTSSGQAHHERGGADDWLGGLSAWGWVVLAAIAGPRRYQMIGPGIGRPLGTLRGLVSGGVVVAVAVTASGQEAFDGALEAGHASFESKHALGQRLYILPHVGQPAADFGQAGINFGAQALVVRAEFGSEGLAVGSCVTPKREQQTNDGRANGEDSDEFGGHGRLQRVGLLIHRPWGFNASTDRIQPDRRKRGAATLSA